MKQQFYYPPSRSKICVVSKGGFCYTVNIIYYSKHAYEKKRQWIEQAYKVALFPQNQETIGDKKINAGSKEEEKNQIMHPKNR